MFSVSPETISLPIVRIAAVATRRSLCSRRDSGVRADGTEGAAALIAEHRPWFSTRRRHRPRLLRRVRRARTARSWVAEDDGEIVGWGEAEFDWVDRGGRRRPALGSSCPDRGAAASARRSSTRRRASLRDGARRAAPAGDAAGRAVRRAARLRRVASEGLSAVDPRTSTRRGSRRARPTGVRIVRLVTLLEAASHELHALYAEAAADMPADHPGDEPPARRVALGDARQARPRPRGQLRRARRRPSGRALVGRRRPSHAGAPSRSSPARRRAYRRRGLARVAKLAVVRLVRRRTGITRLFDGERLRERGHARDQRRARVRADRDVDE